jgi:hypothetical protein
MALQGNYYSPDFESDFTNVYFKIDGIFADFVLNEIRVHVRGYVSKEARDKDANGVFKKVFKYPIPDYQNTYKSVMKYAYGLVKREMNIEGMLDV